jgi:hypothetical protein
VQYVHSVIEIIAMWSILALRFLLLLSTIVPAAEQIHWVVTGPTSVTFDWKRTNAEEMIHYGISPGTYTDQVTAVAPDITPYSSSGLFWEARLQGLLQDTIYHCAIGGGPAHTFHTPRRPGYSDFVVYAQGDVGLTNSYFRMGGVQDVIADGQPAFVPVEGELAYGNAEGMDDVEQHFNDVMVWSQDAAYMSNWSNHEWDNSSDDLRNYKGRFDFPNLHTSPGSPSVSCCGEDWYWFDYGNTRFIAYPEPWSGAWSDWSDHPDILMSEAQSDPSIRFIVTFDYRPPYSTGHHPGSSSFKGIIDTLGYCCSKYVLNVNIHSHNYGWTSPQHGVVHVTVGTGGSSLETDDYCLWLECSQPSWSAYRAMHHGAFKLRFVQNGIAGEFVCGPSDSSKNDVTCAQGEVLDTVTIGAAPDDDNGGNDTVSPWVPTAVTAVPVSLSRINLSWTASSDNVAIAGYKIYRDGTQVATSANTSYSDIGLSPSTTYTYAVAAYDAASNTSQQSSSVSATSEGSVSTPLVTDPNAVFSMLSTSEPAYLGPTVDPVFGAVITRIGGNTGTTISFGSDGSGTWGSDVRHHYSKDQPWNADNSLIVLQNSGSPSQVYLDGNTYQPKFTPCSDYSNGDDRWHPSLNHANERINVHGSMLEWFNVVTCERTKSISLPFSVNHFGFGEGNPSFDGRYAALADNTRMIIIDMETGKIGPSYNVSSCGLSSCTIGWVSISPSGMYAVVSYHGDHVRVFDVEPSTLALYSRPMPPAAKECLSDESPSQGYVYDLGHADMTLNPYDDNEDVLVGQRRSWCSFANDDNGKAIGQVVMVRLRDGKVTTLTSPSNSASVHHLSARSNERPGWVYAGFYPDAGKRYSDEIVAVKLDGSETVERLAHKHSAFSGCYRCESHAVPSRDGRRVLFASNWMLNCGSSCGASSDVKAYVVDTSNLRKVTLGAR